MKSYRRTLSLDYALAHDYIGEIELRPTIIAASIAATKRKIIPTFTMYYHGKPDKELCKKFQLHYAGDEDEDADNSP